MGRRSAVARQGRQTVHPPSFARRVLRDSLAVDIGPGGIEARWSDSNADDFAKNQLRARVEGRFGLDVYQPAGIVKATLTGV